MYYTVHCLSKFNDELNTLNINAASKAIAIYIAIEKLLDISVEESDELFAQAYDSGIELIDAYKQWARERELWLEVE